MLTIRNNIDTREYNIYAYYVVVSTILLLILLYAYYAYPRLHTSCTRQVCIL